MYPSTGLHPLYVYPITGWIPSTCILLQGRIPSTCILLQGWIPSTCIQLQDWIPSTCTYSITGLDPLYEYPIIGLDHVSKGVGSSLAGKVSNYRAGSANIQLGSWILYYQCPVTRIFGNTSSFDRHLCQPNCYHSIKPSLRLNYRGFIQRISERTISATPFTYSIFRLRNLFHCTSQRTPITTTFAPVWKIVFHHTLSFHSPLFLIGQSNQPMKHLLFPLEKKTLPMNQRPRRVASLRWWEKREEKRRRPNLRRFPATIRPTNSNSSNSASGRLEQCRNGRWDRDTASCPVRIME